MEILISLKKIQNGSQRVNKAFSNISLPIFAFFDMLNHILAYDKELTK